MESAEEYLGGMGSAEEYLGGMKSAEEYLGGMESAEEYLGGKKRTQTGPNYEQQHLVSKIGTARPFIMTRVDTTLVHATRSERVFVMYELSL